LGQIVFYFDGKVDNSMLFYYGKCSSLRQKVRRNHKTVFAL